MMMVALQLVSICNKQLPSYTNDAGDFDDEKFLKKLQALSKFPMHMIASIGVNTFWFDIRVRSLFVAEKVGNG